MATSADVAEAAEAMETGLAHNDTHPEEKPWFEGENYKDLDEDDRRIAPKYESEMAAAKAGLKAQRLVNAKVRDMLIASPGLIKESGLEETRVLQELGAVKDVTELQDFGGPPAEDYCQPLKDAYDPEEEARLKAVMVASGLLPSQIKALYEHREREYRLMDRVLREKEQAERSKSDVAKEQFRQREGWSGDGFNTNMTQCQRAARQYGDDALADRVKAMHEGKENFDPALINVLAELSTALVKEGATISGERQEAANTKSASGSGPFDFPEMDK